MTPQAWVWLGTVAALLLISWLAARYAPGDPPSPPDSSMGE